MENKTGKGRGKGRVSASEARERAQQHLGGAGQTASGGEAPTRGTGTRGGGRGRKAANEAPTRGTGTRGGGRGQRAADGQQRGENNGGTKTRGTGTGTGGNDAIEVNGIKIETVTVPGRGGRQMSAEKYPFSALTPATKQADGSLVGPSFLIPASSDDKPDNVLAAARKRHSGKTFISRKVDGGVRVWLEPTK